MVTLHLTVQTSRRLSLSGNSQALLIHDELMRGDTDMCVVSVTHHHSVRSKRKELKIWLGNLALTQRRGSIRAKLFALHLPETTWFKSPVLTLPSEYASKITGHNPRLTGTPGACRKFPTSVSPPPLSYSTTASQVQTRTCFFLPFVTPVDLNGTIPGVSHRESSSPKLGLSGAKPLSVPMFTL